VHYDSCPLGHDKLDTTARYTRVATGMIAGIESPLDLLSQPRKKPKGAGRRRRRYSGSVPRPALEVADIFRDHGATWRKGNAGHVSLDQLKVMSAIERCRTAALGGHVARCEDCAHTLIAYNSCRNRHCPKCQGAAAKEWLAERESELLPVGYFHVVFTLPAPIAEIAYQNKTVIYDLLFRAAAETVLTIAADPKHLGARVGITAVLHTWGSALTHHPHVHMIVPGGGISLDGNHWVSCRPRFFLPVRVLSRLFRRLFLQMLAKRPQTSNRSTPNRCPGCSPPAIVTRHNLVFGRSGRIVTMIQSCASAAKLRGDGSNLHSGFEAMVLRRITATSDRHRQT
jgi:hypothetical protein